MERTAIEASKLIVVRYDHDGKEIDRFHLHNAGNYHFADLANTLDHARQTGLEPYEDEKKPAIVKK
jgi:hypothetical protein